MNLCWELMETIDSKLQMISEGPFTHIVCLDLNEIYDRTLEVALEARGATPF